MVNPHTVPNKKKERHPGTKGNMNEIRFGSCLMTLKKNGGGGN